MKRRIFCALHSLAMGEEQEVEGGEGPGGMLLRRSSRKRRNPAGQELAAVAWAGRRQRANGPSRRRACSADSDDSEETRARRDRLREAGPVLRTAKFEEGQMQLDNLEHWPALDSDSVVDFRLPRWRAGLLLGLWHDADGGENKTEFSFPMQWVEEIIGEDQPPPFRRLQRNAYPDQSIRARMIVPKSQVPVCHCTPEVGCGVDCLNRSLLQECVVGTCPSSQPYCKNSAIQERRFPATEVFRCGGGRGWGLRLSKDEVCGIPAGMLIIEYLGEVITTEECRQRLAEPDRGHDFYFASLNSQLVLDAAPMGSDARFANHSCSPNCQLQKWSVAGEPRVVLEALRPISPGEELLYNYRADTLDGLVCRQRCLCGAPNCAGTIGGDLRRTGVAEWRDEAMRILGSARSARLPFVREVLYKGHQLGIPAGREMGCLEGLLEEGEKWIARWEALRDRAASPDGRLMSCSELRELAEDHAPDGLLVEEHLEVKRLLKRALSVRTTIAGLLYACRSHGAQVDTALSAEGLELVKAAEISWLSRGRQSLQPGASRSPPPKPTTNEMETASRDALALKQQDFIHLEGVEALQLVWEPVHAWARSCCRILRIGPSAGRSKSAPEAVPLSGLEMLERRLEEVAGFSIMRDESDRRRAKEEKAQAKEERTKVLDERRKKKRKLQGNGEQRKSSRFSLQSVEGGESAAKVLDQEKEEEQRQMEPAPSVNVQELTPPLVEVASENARELPLEDGRGDDDDISDSDENTLHCLCRLPEKIASSKSNRMRTLVKCDGCRKWYHPLCIHSRECDLTRSAQGQRGFSCPICLHLSGASSDLAAGPPPGFYLSRSLQKPKVKDMKQAIDAGMKLPLQGIAALSFIQYICDKVEDWQSRVHEALSAVDDYIVRGLPGTASTHTSRFQVLALPSTGRDLVAESAIVEQLGQLLCEGSLLHVLDTSEEDTKMRRILWRIVSSLIAPAAVPCLRSPTHPVVWSEDDAALYKARNWRSISSLSLLAAALKEGERLGLSQPDMGGAVDPVYVVLQAAFSDARSLLLSGYEAPLQTAAAAAAPLRSMNGWLSVSTDYGYSRAIAAELSLRKKKDALSGASSGGDKACDGEREVVGGEEQEDSVGEGTANILKQDGGGKATAGEQPSDDGCNLEVTVDAEASGGAYCLCRGPDDGSFMLACDGCDDWYHATCVGVSFKKKALASNFVFRCIACCAEAGEDYPYKWKCFFALPPPKPRTAPASAAPPVAAPSQPANGAVLSKKEGKGKKKMSVVLGGGECTSSSECVIQDKKARALHAVSAFVASRASMIESACNGQLHR